MNVIMVHPLHGAKVASFEAEIQQDEKNGWTRYNADTPAQAAAPVDKPKRKPRKVTDQPIEQPNEMPEFLASASNESEGE